MGEPHLEPELLELSLSVVGDLDGDAKVHLAGRRLLVAVLVRGRLHRLIGVPLDIAEGDVNRGVRVVVVLTGIQRDRPGLRVEGVLLAGAWVVAARLAGLGGLLLIRAASLVRVAGLLLGVRVRVSLLLALRLRG